MSSNNSGKRKRLSGYAYKQIRKQKRAQDERESGRLQFLFDKELGKNTDLDQETAQFVQNQNSTPTNSSEVSNSNLSLTPIVQSAIVLSVSPTPCASNSVVVRDNIEDLNSNVSCTNNNFLRPEVNVIEQCLNLDDIAKWPAIMSMKISQLIVEKGPNHVQLENYPLKKQRKFSNRYYVKKANNGENISRDWLVYSISSDAVFCFCCRLFSKTRVLNIVTDGFSDWAHAQNSFHSHENSDSHLKCYVQWKELKIRLQNNSTVDNNLQHLMDLETNIWREVLKRIVTLVTFLGTQSLSCRGTSEQLYAENNGNFLKLIECVAKFDNTLSNHLKKITNQETRNQYLSKNIQNEIIQMVSDAVRSNILSMIKNAKYFSIIVDATPDKSRVEQITLIIRFVLINDKQQIEVREHFMGFLIGTNTSGHGLTELVLDNLSKLTLSIKHCRGQGYDNGSNMKGKNIGMQTRIRAVEPRAFFVPCASHSLNLVVNDAVRSNLEIVKFFDIIQQVYVFFSRSTHRWAIYKRNVSGLTVKPLSDTRWESRIDALNINWAKLMKHSSKRAMKGTLRQNQQPRVCLPKFWSLNLFALF